MNVKLPEDQATPAIVAGRQSAREVLETRLRRQEGRAAALAVLTKVIPWKLLSPEDEKVLWQYFVDRH